RATGIWWSVFPVLACIVSVSVLVAVGRRLDLPAWPLFGAAGVTSLFAWRLHAGRNTESALLCMIIAALLTWTATFGVVAPSLGPLFPSVTLSDIMRTSGCAQPLAVTTFAYQEPSLVFLAGTTTRATDPLDAVEFLRGGDCRFAFVA